MATHDQKPWWMQDGVSRELAGLWTEATMATDAVRAETGAVLDLRNACGKEPFRRFLWQQQDRTNLFPASHGRANPDIIAGMKEPELHARYSAVLTEYDSGSHPVRRDKVDYPPENCNLGYKLHLNIPIASVRAVSDYLIRGSFHHKYLCGGDITDGKIFTIYIGSQRLALRLAEQISHDLDGHLAKPCEPSEIELAPNVCGRFKGSDTDFTPYPCGGLRGIPLVRSLQDLVWSPPEKQKQALPQAFAIFYNHLASQYGAFFHG
ncbi:hypothetical protein HZA43_03275 [Candidatus Peregrinibacteria bacterium]|nr:hypothetical protein [Candidatus Peregrinibacteria bacterium]